MKGIIIIAIRICKLTCKEDDFLLNAGFIRYKPIENAIIPVIKIIKRIAFNIKDDKLYEFIRSTIKMNISITTVTIKNQ